MANPTEPHREHPSTYFVQDRSNTQEMDRLRIQDQMLTASMGGVLPEQADPTNLRRVLDVGCGTGDWLIEVASAYPQITTLVGVDVSKSMLDYARTQAAEKGVADRVAFHVMDALRMLEFPQGYFDLINQRLGVSYLRTWDWPNLLQEYQRVTRRGGVIRITESDISHGNSAALTQMSQIFLETMAQAGHFSRVDMNATIEMLPALLRQQGLKDVHSHTYSFRYPAATPQGTAFYKDMQHFFRNVVPFLRKWTRLPDDYEHLYQQMLVEMQQPDFVGEWNFITVWGTNLG
ncbi:MAG: hypothetical protein NVS2B12_06100 [Ktedonobacteraceae bacterium]